MQTIFYAKHVHAFDWYDVNLQLEEIMIFETEQFDCVCVLSVHRKRVPLVKRSNVFYILFFPVCMATMTTLYGVHSTRKSNEFAQIKTGKYLNFSREANPFFIIPLSKWAFFYSAFIVISSCFSNMYCLMRSRLIL